MLAGEERLSLRSSTCSAMARVSSTWIPRCLSTILARQTRNCDINALLYPTSAYERPMDDIVDSTRGYPAIKDALVALDYEKDAKRLGR